jgi:hypothetical protein
MRKKFHASRKQRASPENAVPAVPNQGWWCRHGYYRMRWKAYRSPSKRQPAQAALFLRSTAPRRRQHAAAPAKLYVRTPSAAR